MGAPRARRALAGTATVLVAAGVAGCDGLVEGGTRLDVPVVLSLELARGPVTWILDSLTVTVDAGDESQVETLPVEVGVGVYELDFEVPDGRIRIEASVTSTRGLEVMTAEYDGPADDVIDLDLAPVAPILAVSAARPQVAPDEPGLFQIFNLGNDDLEWSVDAVTPGNDCPVASFARPCLRFVPAGGVIPADGMDSVTVELVAGAVETYGLEVESVEGAVLVDATVTAAPEAGLEVHVTDTSGAGAGGEAVEVAGPVTLQGATDDGGHVVFTGLPLGAYLVTLASTGDEQSVALLENGAFESLAFTVRPNQPPVADAGGPYSGVERDPILLDGRRSTDVDGTIVRWDWDFGDGTDSLDAGPRVSHAWDEGGNYTVRLTVTDDDGATDTDSAAVSVSFVVPVSGVGTVVDDRDADGTRNPGEARDSVIAGAYRDGSAAPEMLPRSVSRRVTTPPFSAADTEAFRASRR